MLVLAAAGACTGPSAGDLVVQGDPASVCTPVGGDSGAVIALDTVKNTGSEALTIDRVTPVGGAGIEVLGATIVPDSDPSAFRGVTVAASEGQTGYRDATLAPGAGGIVKVTLRLTGGHGDADALRIEYHADGSHRTLAVDTVITIRLIPTGSSCSS